jgi:hypothetical protein
MISVRGSGRKTPLIAAVFWPWRELLDLLRIVSDRLTLKIAQCPDPAIGGAVRHCREIPTPKVQSTWWLRRSCHGIYRRGGADVRPLGQRVISRKVP